MLQAVGRPARRRFPRSSPSRPMPAPPRRSTSTASSATTISAQVPNRATCQVNLPPKGERDRASHAIALELRERLAGLDLPAGTVAQGGRAAAGTAGARDAARRDLRPRRRDAPRGGGQGARDLRERPLHRRRRRFLRHAGRRACGSASTRTISNTTRSSRPTSTTRSGATLRRHDGRLLAPRRRPPADPDPRRRCSKSERVVDERALATPVPANALPGERDDRRARRRRPVDARAGLLSRSSATTAAPPRW